MGLKCSKERKEEVDIREESINRYPGDYNYFARLKIEKTEKELQIIKEIKAEKREKRRLERQESKKRYVRENFLGDYPLEKINSEFIYNDNFTDSFDHGIPRLFIDFSAKYKNRRFIDGK